MSAPMLLTTRAQIRTVAQRWREQYYRGGSWMTVMRGESSQVIYDKLAALDPETVSPETVEAIIGNSSWTRIGCDGCDRDVDAAVQVGQPPDYESSTATLCGDCLAAAVALLGAPSAPTPELHVTSEKIDRATVERLKKFQRGGSTPEHEGNPK